LALYEQDRHVGVPPKLQAETDAVEARHHHIERDHVGVDALEGLDGLTGVGDDMRRVPLLGEDAR
jgi:hypothetical protein